MNASIRPSGDRGWMDDRIRELRQLDPLGARGRASRRAPPTRAPIGERCNRGAAPPRPARDSIRAVPARCVPGIGDILQTPVGPFPGTGCNSSRMLAGCAGQGLPIRLALQNRRKRVRDRLPVKGGRPVSISYSTQPNAQMSVRLSTGCAARLLGAHVGRACRGSRPSRVSVDRDRRRLRQLGTPTPTRPRRLRQAEVEHLHGRRA